jgi:hypothetical protein
LEPSHEAMKAIAEYLKFPNRDEHGDYWGIAGCGGQASGCKAQPVAGETDPGWWWVPTDDDIQRHSYTVQGIYS